MDFSTQLATPSHHTAPNDQSPTALTFADTTWASFQRLGKDFLDALPTATADEAAAGWKCVGLAYLACTYDEKDPLQVNAQQVQAPALMRILARKYMERQFELEAEPEQERPPAPAA